MINYPPKNNTVIGDFALVLDEFYLWTNPKDEHVGRSCRDFGYWEPDFTQWMIRNIKPGFKCLDIGANIGYYTELMARLSGINGKVYAFEPNKELVSNYSKAKELNDYSNCAEIEVFPFALSNENTSAYLSGPLANIGGAGIMYVDAVEDPNYFIQEIETRRLDSVLDQEIDFIKIDVEGHEPEAFEGFSEGAKNCKLIVAELGPYHPKEFLVSLSEKYYMEDFDSHIVSVEMILNHPHFINVVLRKKL